MKYKITFVILLILALAGFYFRNDIANFYLQLTQNLSQFEKISIDSLLNKVDLPISLPPPLRLPQQEQESFLTKSGVIKWTNEQRTANNLPALSENSKLDNAALAKAKDMFAQQYFAHVSPSGVGPSDLAKNVGYDFIAIGENLALGNFKDDQALVEAWMNSPGHRANILNSRYTEIGVAVIKGTFEGQTTWMAVQEFGLPLSACPQPDQTIKAAINSYNNQLDLTSQTLERERSELENTKGMTREEYIAKLNAYNQLVVQYNDLVAQVKALIKRYNSQVESFNACVQ